MTTLIALIALAQNAPPLPQAIFPARPSSEVKLTLQDDKPAPPPEPEPAHKKHGTREGAQCHSKWCHCLGCHYETPEDGTVCICANCQCQCEHATPGPSPAGSTKPASTAAVPFAPAAVAPAPVQTYQQPTYYYYTQPQYPAYYGAGGCQNGQCYAPRGFRLFGRWR